MGGDVIGYFFHEPLETLAVVVLPELLELRYIPVWQCLRLGTAGVEVVFVFVPPNFDNSNVILRKGKPQAV